MLPHTFTRVNGSTYSSLNRFQNVRVVVCFYIVHSNWLSNRKRFNGVTCGLKAPIYSVHRSILTDSKYFQQIISHTPKFHCSVHGEIPSKFQKSSARTNTKKTTIWSIGWIGVDRFEGVWHPNFINPLEYEKSFHNQLSLSQPQLFFATPRPPPGYNWICSNK